MEKRSNYLSFLVILVLVFTTQLTFVNAAERVDDYDLENNEYFYMSCQVSIWAAPKAGGGVYMNKQYFSVYVYTKSAECGVYTCQIIFRIQGAVYYSDIYEAENPPELGPDVIFNFGQFFYEYRHSYMVVWAAIEVILVWEPQDGGDIDITSISAEACYE